MRSLGPYGRLLRHLRAAPLTFVLLGTSALALGSAGCRINNDDLHRWENTQRGPDKLRAVLLHDKYEMPLRIECAVSLVRMKPRSGRFVGIDILVDTLAEVPADQREKILNGVVPVLVEQLKKEPPAAQAGQPAPPDPSYAYKDAGYAILIYEKQVLLADQTLGDNLRAAIIDWAMRDFDRRLENRAQKYGMEQVLRYLGPDGVVGLPEKINKDSRNLEKIANLIDEIAKPATKEAASTKYVEVAKWIISPEWIQAATEKVKSANLISKLTPDEKQFQQQVEAYQDEELQRVLGSLRKVGGRAAVDFGLTLGADTKAKEDRRAWALASLELRLDPQNADDVKRVFAIATSDSPPKVLDMAFGRISEMPRKIAIEKLYEAMKSDKWKVRRQAGVIALRMSDMRDVDEFMSKLPEKEAKGFAREEARAYGAYIGGLKNGDPRTALEKYLTPETPIAQRAVAFSFYRTDGKESDLAKMAPFEGDKVAMPVCEGDDDCKWTCDVPKDEKKPEETESKEVKTFGEFVKYCVEPTIKWQAKALAEKAAAEKALAEKKGDKK